jgi:hypothetical protein
MLKRISALLLSTAVMAACSEPTVPSEATETPPQGRELLAELTCAADVVAARLSCAPASASLSSGALGDLIIGGQGTYVKLASGTVVNNGTTFSVPVTVQNLTVQPWATADGTTPSAEGVRVFFHTLPNNGVTVANADGSDTFTAAAQPYYRYKADTLGADSILVAGDTSLAKTWVFNLNGAGSFTFKVYVVTTLPDELGVLRWLQQTVPANDTTYETLNTVWGSSANDVWFGGFAGANGILHWNGTSFTSTRTGHDVNQIWGSSSTDVYAVGGDSIKHWGGTSWSGVATGASSALLSVWGSSSTDVYAGGLFGTLVHSTGGAFSAVSSTGIGNSEPVSAIWGSSDSDVWVGATSVYHWNGTSWSSVNTGLSNIRAIWGSSATDIWMGATVGNMTHYNGTSWTPTSGGVGTADIGGIWGTASNDVYMVNRAGEIWHYNGASWVKYEPLAGTALLSVWGSGRTNVWAVGTDTPGFTVKRAFRGLR